MFWPDFMLRRRAILSLTARKDPVKNKVKLPLFCSPQERCLGILVSHGVRFFENFWPVGCSCWCPRNVVRDLISLQDE